MNEVLGIGITGHSLTDLERRIIRDTPPYGVVLFGRNVGDPRQLRELVAEIRSIASKPPLFMIDEEGGRVDRLRALIPGLPSVEGFGEGEQPLEMSRWAGRVIGMALRYFDIEVNLAPVVDIRGGASPKGLERRTFGSDVESVVTLAGAFIDGQHAEGVASCLKHFPGIGTGSADPHYGATVIDLSLDELRRRDLAPFARLGNVAGAIMIGHGTYPQIDDSHPASLSHRITTDVLRDVVQFNGVAMSDDMEMHAVSDLGSYEYTAECALLAGNDVVMYCSHIERMPELERHIHARVAEDAALHARFEEARTRAERYREHCAHLRANGAAAAQSFEAVAEEAARFLEAFNKSRRGSELVSESQPHKGDRTGREEWT
jgi:beta-N-acetylhexosaminidase